MENASKALIIAGAILISIVIISLGVVIVNNVTGIIQNAGDMSAQEVATFNAKFSSYEGERVSGTNARALYDLLKTHNNQNTDEPSQQVILKVYKKTDTNPTFSEYEEPAEKDVMGSEAGDNKFPEKSEIPAGKSYKIKFAVDKGNSRITKCYIAPVSGT